MREAIEQVEEFHNAIADAVPEMSILRNNDPNTPAVTRACTRVKLLREEYDEHVDAVSERNVEALADAYADMIYVILGSALMQIGKERFIRVWDEVCRSNMAKQHVVDGKKTFIIRGDGKILKPDGWVGPRIKLALDLLQDMTEP